MGFYTDRKRAVGLGAGGSGSAAHWRMIATSFAILVLVPASIWVIGCTLGGDLASVTEKFSKPVPVIIMALTFTIGILHFKAEVDEAVEDYVGGIKRKLTLIAVSAFCYTLMATGLFALLKLALS